MIEGVNTFRGLLAVGGPDLCLGMRPKVVGPLAPLCDVVTTGVFPGLAGDRMALNPNDRIRRYKHRPGPDHGACSRAAPGHWPTTPSSLRADDADSMDHDARVSFRDKGDQGADIDGVQAGRDRRTGIRGLWMFRRCCHIPRSLPDGVTPAGRCCGQPEIACRRRLRPGLRRPDRRSRGGVLRALTPCVHVRIFRRAIRGDG